MKSCPFCGCVTTFLGVGGNEKEMYTYVCGNCHAAGPRAASPENAKCCWDRRPADFIQADSSRMYLPKEG